MVDLQLSANEINACLRKAEQYEDRHKQMMIAGGYKLIEARREVQQQGLHWQDWIGKNIVWSYQKAMRCISYVESDDPETAVDEDREADRARKKEQRDAVKPPGRPRGSTEENRDSGAGSDAPPPRSEPNVFDVLDEAKQASNDASEKRISKAVKAFSALRGDEREIALRRIEEMMGFQL